MMDWLAERYVILWSKAVFFVENPTSCDWIDFFQAAFVLLSTGWLLRTAYALLQSRTITKARPGRSKTTRTPTHPKNCATLSETLGQRSRPAQPTPSTPPV